MRTGVLTFCLLRDYHQTGAHTRCGACHNVAGVTKIRGTDELDGDLDDAASPRATPGSSLKADSAGAISLADSEALVSLASRLLVLQGSCWARSGVLLRGGGLVDGWGTDKVGAPVMVSVSNVGQ